MGEESEKSLVPAEKPVKIGRSRAIDREPRLLRLHEESEEWSIYYRHHNAKKQWRKVQEELEIERLEEEALNDLERTYMSTIRYGPARDKEIDWRLVPPDLRQLIGQMSEVTGWKKFPVFMALLGIIAMALRGRVVVRLDSSWSEVVILYLVIAAPPGSKKSSLLEIISLPIRQYEIDLQNKYNANNSPERKEYVATVKELKKKFSQKIMNQIVKDNFDGEIGPNFAEFFSSVQAPLEALRSAAAEHEGKKDALPRILTDKATHRALCNLMSEQGGAIAVLSAEADSLLSMLTTPGANLDLFNKGYTTEDFREDTARSSQIIRRPVLNLLYIAHEDTLSRICKNQRFVSVGLAARFLPHFAEEPSITSIDKEYEEDEFSIL